MYRQYHRRKIQTKRKKKKKKRKISIVSSAIENLNSKGKSASYPSIHVRVKY